MHFNLFQQVIQLFLSVNLIWDSIFRSSAGKDCVLSKTWSSFLFAYYQESPYINNISQS